MEIHAWTMHRECKHLIACLYDTDGQYINVTRLRWHRSKYLEGARCNPAERFKKLHNPFEEVENEEVLRMIYKWFANQSGKVKTVQLRIHNESEKIMHYVGFQVHVRHVYVRYVHDLPSNPQRLTHVWRPYTAFINLTIEEIRNSTGRAWEINYLATAKQMEEELAPDKLIEKWLPEVNDPEVSHMNDNKAFVKEVLELLQGENLP